MGLGRGLRATTGLGGARATMGLGRGLRATTGLGGCPGRNGLGTGAPGHDGLGVPLAQWRGTKWATYKCRNGSGRVRTLNERGKPRDGVAPNGD